MRIIFPEYENPKIQTAIKIYQNTNPDFVAFPAKDLKNACLAVKQGVADSLIAGIDYSSRDVILACREYFSMAPYPQITVDQPIERYNTFSGLAIMQKTTENGTRTFLLADMAACKHPNRQQLVEIILQTYTSACKILAEPPRLALLSFSTFGSGGQDATITLLQEALEIAKSFENIKIDGEMQLDAAINPEVARKKIPNSPVAGQANVLIVPDLNSGNLLYKCFEQIGGYTVAGPLLQGFAYPLSDLSRGSTVNDILLTIDSLSRLTSNSTN